MEFRLNPLLAKIDSGQLRGKQKRGTRVMCSVTRVPVRLSQFTVRLKLRAFSTRVTLNYSPSGTFHLRIGDPTVFSKKRKIVEVGTTFIRQNDVYFGEK